jgi:nucleoside-diphosphate-sugar epimerase
MSFLITGGSGCIGSYVLRDLLGRGERVVNYDAGPGVQILNQVVPRDTLEKYFVKSGETWMPDFPAIGAIPAKDECTKT